ncbi:MAG: aldo/keto reductase [Rhizobiales bacterium]|nr:aldo/keto reductase [Hyphomicrobiales bacterium]
MNEETSGGRTGNRISRVGLGTVQFGINYGISNVRGKVPRNEVADVLSAARQSGILWLDTASAYGQAEQALGDLDAAKQGFRIVSKTMPKTDSTQPIIDQVRRSMDLLRVEKLDGLLVHQARDLNGPDGTALWNTLEHLKASGDVSRIGISAYYEDDPLALVQSFEPDLLQIPTSILDQRLIRNGDLAAIRARGVSIHARSVFLQGLLFLTLDQLPPKLQQFHGLLSQIKEQIRECGSTPLAAAIAFVLDRPEIDVAVVGATSVTEITEILQAAEKPHPSMDWRNLSIDDPLALTPSLWHT